MLEKNTTPGSYYQPLFDLLHQKHGLTLVESEMVDIIHVVERMQGEQHGAVEYYPDLSSAPSELKAETINGLVEVIAREVLKMFYAFGLKTHIECTIKNDPTNEEFDFIFRKKDASLKNTLTQSRADFIREVNDRDMDGLEAIEFAEWFWSYCKEYHRGGTYVTNFNEVMTVKELYELFKQQKEKR